MSYYKRSLLDEDHWQWQASKTSVLHQVARFFETKLGRQVLFCLIVIGMTTAIVIAVIAAVLALSHSFGS